MPTGKKDRAASSQIGRQAYNGIEAPPDGAADIQKSSQKNRNILVGSTISWSEKTFWEVTFLWVATTTTADAAITEAVSSRAMKHSGSSLSSPSSSSGYIITARATMAAAATIATCPTAAATTTAAAKTGGKGAGQPALFPLRMGDKRL